MAVILMALGCSPDLRDSEIPLTQFDPLVINLNAPSYNSLKTDGGFYYENSIGVRGVILYRKSASQYFAYERNCSYQPNEACATVEVHSSTLFMIDPCCSSTFDFGSGSPTGGVAWRPLRKYETTVSGSTLTVTDQIVD